MFGFRLPPDGGPSQKQVSSPSLSTSSASFSEDSESSSNSSSEEEEIEERQDSKTSEPIAIYEDFMPEEAISENKSSTVDSSPPSNTETNALIDCLTKNLVTYFNSIQPETLQTKKTNKKSGSTSVQDESKQKIVKIETLPKLKINIQKNKELERLKKRATVLARLGKTYTEKVEEFLKEFEK